MSINSFFQHRICFSIQPQLHLVNLHRNRRYFVIKLHTWFCLSYFVKSNITIYCIYQYFMSINSFVNTVSVSRYSRPITVTHDPDQHVPAVFFLIMLFKYNILYYSFNCKKHQMTNLQNILVLFVFYADKQNIKIYLGVIY